MRGDEVPAEMVEKVEASLRADGAYSDDVAREWVARHALAAVLPMARQAALNEAADDWQRGEWANAPRRADRVQERIANGQYVGEWLRARADRQTTTEETPDAG